MPDMNTIKFNSFLSKQLDKTGLIFTGRRAKSFVEQIKRRQVEIDINNFIESLSRANETKRMLKKDTTDTFIYSHRQP